jgi:hypothetical protein
LDLLFYVHLHLLDSGSFETIIDSIGAVAESYELGEENCRLNFTGGTKLMSIAATEWCRRAGNSSFYIDGSSSGGQRLCGFQIKNLQVEEIEERIIPTDITNSFDPLDLLRCQIDDDDIAEPGQRLKLNARGEKTPLAELPGLMNSQKPFDFTSLLDLVGVVPEARVGDSLELATAFAILKSGPKQIQRGVCLTSRQRSRDGLDSGEIDLVFNHKGFLWMTDCKNRNAPEFRVDRLRTELLSQAQVLPSVETLLKGIEDELKERELSFLKEDLATLADGGGLFGKSLIVRRCNLPQQAADYARTRNLKVVLSSKLHLAIPEMLA